MNRPHLTPLPSPTDRGVMMLRLLWGGVGGTVIAATLLLSSPPLERLRFAAVGMDLEVVMAERAEEAILTAQLMRANDNYRALKVRLEGCK